MNAVLSEISPLTFYLTYQYTNMINVGMSFMNTVLYTFLNPELYACNTLLDTHSTIWFTLAFPLTRCHHFLPIYHLLLLLLLQQSNEFIQNENRILRNRRKTRRLILTCPGFDSIPPGLSSVNDHDYCTNGTANEENSQKCTSHQKSLRIKVLPHLPTCI